MDPSLIGGVQSWLTDLFTDGAVAAGGAIVNGPDLSTSAGNSNSGLAASTWVEIAALLIFLFLIVALIHEARGL